MTRTQLALALGLMMPTAAAADPLVLDDTQMDHVTAAGLLIDVGSIAAALGRFTIARTGADTYVDLAQQFGIGLTIGEAFACCGPGSQVQVGSAVYGSGDPAHGTTHSAEHEGLFLAYGITVGIVFTGSPPQSLPAYRHALAALRVGLADFGRGAAADLRNSNQIPPAVTAASQ